MSGNSTMSRVFPEISLNDLETKLIKMRENFDKQDVLVKENVQQYICGLHELHCDKNDIIKLDQTPNENKIFHLYGDGEITFQKGSYAYGQRSEFPDTYGFLHYKNRFMFPCTRGTHTYCLLTEDECYDCIKLMKKCA